MIVQEFVIMFSQTQPQLSPEDRLWRQSIDRFVKAHECELGGLVWGLRQLWGESSDILGIDLYPEPHFVACSRVSIERLNQQVKGAIQEILGVIDGHKAEAEVVIIVIGKGQVKLINYACDLINCFEQQTQDTESLLSSLEDRLKKELIIHNS